MANSTQKLDILVNDFQEVIDDMKNKLKTGEFTPEEVDSRCDILQPQVAKLKDMYYNTITL